MDPRFLPAVAAIRSGKPSALDAILLAAPSLAAARSSCSHPTLMQCLVLDGVGLDSEVQLAMAKKLLERGSPVDEPLVATASIGNVVLAAFLLDHGAAIDGSPGVSDGWTPLEESLYWGSPEITKLLLVRGATIPNLRAAAGLGLLDEMKRYFDAEGVLRVADAGGINSPFGALDEEPPEDLPQQILDNALIYAAMGGHPAAVGLLLERGAAVNAHPIGFHYRGTALHWAALRGHRETCDLLLSLGADCAREDLTIQSTPAGWARHEGHVELAAHLDARGKHSPS